MNRKKVKDELKEKIRNYLEYNYIEKKDIDLPETKIVIGKLS